MLDINLGWVTVNVTIETFFTAVLHFDRTRCAQCQKCAMNLKADVFAGSKRATNTAKRDSNFLIWKTKTCGDLFSIFMKPLSSDKHLDAVVATIRYCQSGFKTQEGLVLHSHFVNTFDYDFALQVLVTNFDLLTANQVTVWVNLFGGREYRDLSICNWRQNLVLNFDRCEGSSTSFRMVCRNCGNWFADISNEVACKHRLIT